MFAGVLVLAGGSGDLDGEVTVESDLVLVFVFPEGVGCVFPESGKLDGVLEGLSAGVVGTSELVVVGVSPPVSVVCWLLFPPMGVVGASV